MRAMGHCEVAQAPSPIGFDLSLCKADVDLPELAARIRKAPSKALSFCLSGPPGTGKSAYARHLATVLGLEVLEKRYSDLTSSLLGELRESHRRRVPGGGGRARLPDSRRSGFPAARPRSAHHSWEVTQVNEMLTWMERHPLPFACTTNAVTCSTRRRRGASCSRCASSRWTPARSARPFASPSRRPRLHRSFGSKLLTPGDFAVVARKAEAFGEPTPAGSRSGWRMR